MIKRLFHRFDTIRKKVFFEYKNKKHFFSRPTAFYYALCPYLKKHGQARHKAILNYLAKDECDVIEKWRNAVSDSNNVTAISDDCPIWVMWWQGFNSPPPIVNLCINSIQRNKGKHSVHLLDNSNYKEYITLPDGLEEKLAKSNKIAHLSDIIRFGLLSRYGGIWLDATIYVSLPISGWNLPIYSIRHNKGNPRYILDGWHWSSFMFACIPHQILPTFVYEALLDYFSKHDNVIDYFLTDYFIALIYLNNQEVHKEIDALPADNTDTLELLMNLSRPYDKEWLEQCLTRRRFHKLDWMVNPSGSDTMFAHLK